VLTVAAAALIPDASLLIMITIMIIMTTMTRQKKSDLVEIKIMKFTSALFFLPSMKFNMAC